MSDLTAGREFGTKFLTWSDDVKLSLMTVVLLGLGICGCSGATSQKGTESAARNYFQAEFQKWIAGESSAVATKQSQRLLLAPPISYDIRSIVRGEPDFFACQDAEKLPTDWHNWPAFKLNVAIEWKSEDGSPLTKVTRYLLTWNAAEQRWYASEEL